MATADPTPPHVRVRGLVALVALYLFIVSVVPRPEVITPQGWRTAAIFACVIVGMIIEPLPASALVILGLTAMSANGTPMREVLGGFAEPSVWLVIVAMLIARSMLDTGLAAVMARARVVSRSSVPVLLFGETGTGKEIIARAVHEHSGFRHGPFHRVNCGAIPSELIDAELFGHEPGAFTGAVSRRKGWFEQADGGTLFLDEVGELAPAAQVRLLRVVAGHSPHLERPEVVLPALKAFLDDAPAVTPGASAASNGE